MSQELPNFVNKPEISTIVEDKEYRFISEETEKELDKKIEEINIFMEENHKRGLSDEEIDDIYAGAQKLHKEYVELIKKCKYSFLLNRQQYKFLTDLLTRNMVYNVETVFFALEITDALANMSENSKYVNDYELIGYDVNATEITYIYHLISKYEVKGIVKNTYYFAQVLQTIGDISKIINYYDATSKNLHTDIQNWIITFEENVSLDTDVEEAKVEVKEVEKDEEVAG